MATQIQDINESVAQYANDVRSLLSKIDPNDDYPEHYKIWEFVKGLNAQIAFFVNKENPANLNQAINHAIQTETGYHQTYNNSFSTAVINNQIPQNFNLPINNYSFVPTAPISNQSSSIGSNQDNDISNM